MMRTVFVIAVVSSALSLGACAEQKPVVEGPLHRAWREADAAYSSCVAAHLSNCQQERELAEYRRRILDNAIAEGEARKAAQAARAQQGYGAMTMAGAAMMNASRPQYPTPAPVYVVPAAPYAPQCIGVRCW